MIAGLLRNRTEDGRIIEREIRKEAAFRTNESVKIILLDTGKKLKEYLEKEENADIICADVSLSDGIKVAERLRRHHPQCPMVVVAEESMSPITYLKPSILAAGLLLKPLTPEKADRVFGEIFQQFIEKSVDEESFIIETRNEKYRIPISKILYFESRSKKIYACTRSKEYGFYDTMDRLEEQMLQFFVRCHRSYMVNRKYIKKVVLSKNYLLLQQEIEIPLSRSYKSVLKQLEI